MTLLAGTIRFQPAFDPLASARAMADASCRYPGLAARTLHASEHVALVAIERSEDLVRLVAQRQRDGTERWLLGDCNYAPRQFDGDGGAPPPGRWLTVQIDAAEPRLTIATCLFGLSWLHIAPVPGGYAFCSDFGALAQLLPTLSVDVERALFDLGVGHSPGESSIYREISLVPADATLTLSRDGVTQSRSTPLYGDAFFGASIAEKQARLDGIYARICEDYIARYDPGVIVSLSAGKDSGTALGAISAHGLAPPQFTFGDRRSEEVRNTLALCRRTGRTTTVFEIPDGVWEDWVSRVSLLGTSGMLQFAGWAHEWHALLRTSGNASLIGYLGDALTGKHFGYLTAQANWREAWAHYSVDSIGLLDTPLLRAPVRARLRELALEAAAESVRGVTFASPFQEALHLNLYQRQRRRVGSQPNVISRFLTPLPFFYDRELVHFWCNVPFGDIEGQSLYSSHSRSRFPTVFPTQGAVRQLLQRGARRVLRSFKQDAPPVPVIDHDRIIAHHREQILALAERVRPMVEEWLEVDVLLARIKAPRRDGSVTAVDVIRAVNLFMLLDLSNGKTRR